MRPYLFFILRRITPFLLFMVGPVVSSNAATSVIEVRVANGLYSERHELVRNVVPVQPCGVR